MASQTFQFRPLINKSFPSFEAKSTQEYLLKWGLQEGIRIKGFSYDSYFQIYQKEVFVKCFVEDDSVQQALQVFLCQEKGEDKAVIADVVPASVTNMSFFDKLYQDGLVRETGAICKCYDEQIDDILVSDEVRKMLLSEDSDFVDVFSDKEKQEFIFCLFRHLCIGGPVCQYEDDIKPYLDTTKFLYKDLISVYKNQDGKVAVNSIVMKFSLTENGSQVFPGSSTYLQNFAYLIVDPVKRHVTMLYHASLGF